MVTHRSRSLKNMQSNSASSHPAVPSPAETLPSPQVHSHNSSPKPESSLSNPPPHLSISGSPPSNAPASGKETSRLHPRQQQGTIRHLDSTMIVGMIANPSLSGSWARKAGRKRSWRWTWSCWRGGSLRMSFPLLSVGRRRRGRLLPGRFFVVRGPCA